MKVRQGGWQAEAIRNSLIDIKIEQSDQQTKCFVSFSILQQHLHDQDRLVKQVFVMMKLLNSGGQAWWEMHHCLNFHGLQLLWFFRFWLVLCVANVTVSLSLCHCSIVSLSSYYSVLLLLTFLVWWSIISLPLLAAGNIRLIEFVCIGKLSIKVGSLSHPIFSILKKLCWKNYARAALTLTPI